MRIADIVARRARLPGRAFPRARRRLARRARAVDARAAAAACRRRSRAAPEKRITASLAIDHLATARAHAAAGDRASQRLAVRRASRSTATRARCASRASARARRRAHRGQRRASAGAVHRDEVRPVRASARRRAPSTRSASCRASTSRPSARAPRVLNEAAIVNCTRCGKPLGTQKMIETMLAKLAGHSMFAEPGAPRSAAHVRRLPRGRPHQDREERGHPEAYEPSVHAQAHAAVKLTRERRTAPEDQGRASSTRSSAGCSRAAPDAAALARSALPTLGRTTAAIPLPGHGIGSCWRAAPWTPRPRSRSTPTFSSASARPKCNLHASLLDHRRRDAGRWWRFARDLAALGLARAATARGSTKTSWARCARRCASWSPAPTNGARRRLPNSDDSSSGISQPGSLDAATQ